ncbi:MAG: hypothetical protein P1V51_20135 [Deltaproteobacteria bacterium]|nr:hypothetical protein [Deltaproteobacteria bacterium]
MSTRVLIYDHGSRSISSAIAQAWKSALDARGIAAAFRNPSVYGPGNYEKALATVCHGMAGHNPELIADQLANDGIPIVVEMGYVKRGETVKDHWAVGVGGINAKAHYRNRLAPGDRWEALGVTLAEWRKEGEHVLVCGQVPGDVNLGGIDAHRWARETMDELRKLTDRKIVFRPHPLDPSNVETKVGASFDTISYAPLEEDLAGAWCVVGYTSNSMVDAIIAGVPAISLGESMASPVAGGSLAAVENPPMPDRQQWAHELAYAQWTVAEIFAGLPWEHLIEGKTKTVAYPATEGEPAPVLAPDPVEPPSAPATDPEAGVQVVEKASQKSQEAPEAKIPPTPKAKAAGRLKVSK